MKIGIYTLGCKVNQYETQAMEQELTARGHELVDFESPADAYIINTCSVTAVSDKKSRQMIRRAKKNSPDAVVAACGCYVQTHEEEAKSLGIDLLMGTNDRARFLDRLEEAVKTRETVADIDDALRRRTCEVLPAGGMANRTRAMLKVEDGCVNFCTYCIIPYARGPVRSLPMDKAAEQVRALRAQGYREIPLCEDYDFQIRAVLKGFKLGNCEEVALNYRLSDEGLSRSSLYKQYLYQRCLTKAYKQGKAVDVDRAKEYVERAYTEKKARKYSQANDYFQQAMNALSQKRIAVAICSGVKSIIASSSYADKVRRLILASL